MMDRIYADYAWEQAAALLAIDSPTGYTREAALWVKNAFESLGFAAHITTKGGVIADLGGEADDDGLLLQAHTDTLGGMVATPFKERTCTCKEHNGEIITVDVPTSYYGTLEFESGACASILMSFDIWGARLPIIEIYGSKGTLRVPDPNCFGGPVILHTPDEGDKEIPLCFDYPENSRALGLAEMAAALKAGRRPRASYKQTLHVLEVLTGFERAVKEGGYLELTTKFEREAPMPQGLPHGVLD